MSLLFHKTFVDAVTGANGFEAVGSSNGTASHSADAGLNSTSGGVTFETTGTSANVYGEMTIDLSSASIFRSAWWCDLSDIAIITDVHNTRLFTMEATGGSPTRASLIMLIKRLGVLNFEHYFYNDAGSSTTNTVPLDGYPAWMELRVKRSSAGGVADAETQLYAGGGDYEPLGELVSETTGIIHYTQFTKPMHRYGLRLSSSTVSGSMVFDEWTMRDDDTPILFGVSAEVEAEEAFKGGGGGSKSSLSQYVQIG